MKHFFAALLFGLAVLPGCAMGTMDGKDHIEPIEGTMSGTNELTRITYPVSNLSYLDIGFGYELVLTQGDHVTVQVEVTKGRADEVLTGWNKEKSGELIITRKTDSDDYSFTERVYVTVPALLALDLSGRAKWLDGTLTQNTPFHLDLSAGSDSEVRAEINVPDFSLDYSVFSTNEFSGSCNKVLVEMSQGTILDLSGMQVQELVLNASQNSQFTAAVMNLSTIDASRGAVIHLTQNSGEVRADLSSTAQLNVIGNAEIIEIDN